eukprot:SAG11_NODE_1096_length_5884_cov_4.310631_6_plen_88_part_00
MSETFASPGPAAGPSRSVVVPRLTEVKPLIDLITNHAWETFVTYWYWKWPPQLNAGNRVATGVTLQDATYHGAVRNEGPALRDLGEV